MVGTGKTMSGAGRRKCPSPAKIRETGKQEQGSLFFFFFF